jgi:hypothetical protein
VEQPIPLPTKVVDTSYDTLYENAPVQKGGQSSHIKARRVKKGKEGIKDKIIFIS